MKIENQVNQEYFQSNQFDNALLNKAQSFENQNIFRKVFSGSKGNQSSSKLTPSLNSPALLSESAKSLVGNANVIYDAAVDRAKMTFDKITSKQGSILQFQDSRGKLIKINLSDDMRGSDLEQAYTFANTPVAEAIVKVSKAQKIFERLSVKRELSFLDRFQLSRAKDQFNKYSKILHTLERPYADS